MFDELICKAPLKKEKLICKVPINIVDRKPIRNSFNFSIRVIFSFGMRC